MSSSLSPEWQQICFTETVTDSREVSNDSLFVALAGERTNGHRFLADVAERQARGAFVTFEEIAHHKAVFEQIQRPYVVLNITEHTLPLLPRCIGVADMVELDTQNNLSAVFQHPPDPNIFVLVAVENSLNALQCFARYHRQSVTPKVVAITGSVGKTSTKEVAAAILRRRFRTLKNKKSFNSEVTVPTTLLGITAAHQVAVVELGMWAPGEICLLADLAQPHIGVVTNVGPSHLERMGSMQAIVNAKAELVEALPADGIAILNADNEHVAAMAQRTVAKVVWYGLTPKADIWADAIKPYGIQGIGCTIHADNETYDVVIPFPGVHAIYNALAATAVALVLGVSWDDILQGLQDKEAHIRMLITPASDQGLPYTLIDDTYNASPLSVESSLQVLAQCEGRRIAILGDMLELGSIAEESHRYVGRAMGNIAHCLVCVGPHARWIAEEAQLSGMPADAIILVETSTDAIPLVKEKIEPGDYILIKGSRAMTMEAIVTALMEQEKD